MASLRNYIYVKGDVIYIGKYYFTFKELKELFYSSLILALIFSIAFFEYGGTLLSLFVSFLISFFLVSPSLVFHEIAHKLVAQKYDLRAEYVFWPSGALFSFALTLLTAGRFIFASLGAVMISPYHERRIGAGWLGVTVEENGKISAAGPATNIILAIIFYSLAGFSNLFYWAAQINLIIAIFNLLPIPPLDGSKIFHWSWVYWIFMFASALTLLYLAPVIGVLTSVIISLVLLIGGFYINEKFFPPVAPEMVYM